MSAISNLKALKRKLKNELRRGGYSIDYLLKLSAYQNIGEVGDTCNVEMSEYSGLMPTKLVTLPSTHSMTTFFDVDPLSPCGRFIVVTNVPFVSRIPFLGDKATISVIDLKSGVSTIVYETLGWGAQLGANAQWGADENTIYCNDIVDGKVVGVEIKLDSFSTRQLDGPIYTVDSVKNYSYSPDLKLINAMMAGYGVPETVTKRYRQKSPRSSQNGIWKTNLDSGVTELYISIDEILTALDGTETFDSATYYIFHVKINSQGNRLFFVLFSLGAKGKFGPTTQLVSMDMRSRELKLLISNKQWAKGGHHPNWMPNGEDILMNLKHADKIMRFVKISAIDGNIITLSDYFIGGGHPTIDSSGNYILTDAYVSEGLGDSEGKVPIRLINLNQVKEIHIAKIFTNNLNGPCRIDPHPFWSQRHNLIIWNGIIEGKRRVFISDSSNLNELWHN